MRQALLSQVQSDLLRCHEVLKLEAASESIAGNMVSLCRTAHEIKGIAATIGAVVLSKLAEDTEAACASHDVGTTWDLLQDLRDQTKVTTQSLAELAQD